MRGRADRVACPLLYPMSFRYNNKNCWVKQVQFSNEALIFKSFNPAYPDIVKQKTDVIQMERVECAIF